MVNVWIYVYAKKKSTFDIDTLLKRSSPDDFDWPATIFLVSDQPCVNKYEANT